jgi:predicted nucleic-acid-binding Zn-ribbon protein
MTAKILVFDIETAPDLADVWSFWNTNVGLNQVRRDGWIMSFAAKWLGGNEIIYEENRTQNDRSLVKKLLKLIDEADIVVAHNGKSFDMGWVRSKAAIHGLAPPSPVKIIDTLIESRKLFKFTSHRLEYLLRRFKCAPKHPHKKYPGHELWVECMKGNDEAWEELKVYNCGDVTGLEELYLKMRPWITSHPNLNLYHDKEEIQCNKCGSNNLKKDGTVKLIAGVYQAYSCKDCGGWSRSNKNLLSSSKRKSNLVNVQ